MFGRRRVDVALGDIFIETLKGKKKIFRAMGVADATPSEAFESLWEVTEICDFNGLPHAKLTNHESGLLRTIALDALERQEIYRKKQLTRCPFCGACAQSHR